MQQAGWAAFDAGWHRPARQLYKKSYLAAIEAGETALAANALAFRAYQLVGNGEHLRASECTNQSLTLAAVPLFESALSGYEDSHARDKALYLTWLVEAYLEAGKPEQAAQVTHQALDLSADVILCGRDNASTPWCDGSLEYGALPEVSRLLTRCRPHDPF